MRIDEYGHIINDDDDYGRSDYVDEYGHIVVNDPADIPVRRNASPASALASATPSRSWDIPVPWYGHGWLYWTVTLLLAAPAAWASYVYLTPFIASLLGLSSDTIDQIVWYCYLYGMPAGAYIGCIWYNVSGTKQTEDYYTGVNYCLSPLCAVAGVASMAVLITVAVIVIAIFVAIFSVVIGIAILLGLLSGG